MVVVSTSLLAAVLVACSPGAQTRYAELRAGDGRSAGLGTVGAGERIAGGADGLRTAEFAGDRGVRAAPAPMQAVPAEEPFVLVAGWGGPSVPEDFDLGRLFDERRATGAAARAGAVLRDLFTDLGRGRIRSNALDPERRFLLTLQLEDVVEGAVLPSSVVIGRPASNSDVSAEFPVRVLSPRGTAQGHVYLIIRGNQWYITDIHVDFRLLEHPEEARDRAYEPTTYEWTIRRP